MGLFSRNKSKSPQPSSQYQVGPPAYSATNYNNNYAPPSPPKQPVNSDTRPLPNGWISQYDPNSKRFFYVYTLTALRQWEHPADKPMMNRGENASYKNSSFNQQPYYGQQTQYMQQSPYSQQPQYVQQPQYMQQPMMAGGSNSRYGQTGSGMGGMGKIAAAGIGGGLLGYMIGDAIADSHQPDIIEYNNYYGDDMGGFNDGFDGGGGGGFDDMF
jgi:hypothetical protein